jgi:hypothetical protein
VFILANELRVQTPQFDVCVIGGELPVDLGGTEISIAFPSSTLFRQALPVVDPTGQALPPQHAQFAFGDV